MIRVVVADDQALVRGSFGLLIGTAPDLTVAGEAATGSEVVTVTRRERPDVVLMGIHMPGIDGIEATRRITADPAVAATRVLILTTFDLDQYVYAALRAGASGFLLKDIRPADLLDAVRVVAAGEALLAPTVTRRLIEDFVRRPAESAPIPLPDLTERERQVLRVVADGLANQEIADALHISLSTTKTYIGRLLTKLGARDRAQLVIAAYRAGIAGADSGFRPPGVPQGNGGLGEAQVRRIGHG